MRPMTRVDRYGWGSAAANGGGFVDLVPGDTFAALEEQLKRRISERFDNLTLGISASIGSKRNASELAKHLAAGEEEEVHKFAAKNIGVLFANGKLGISHDDKKAIAGQRWITRFVRVFTPFRFAGNVYLATLTLKDVAPDKKIYAVEAVEINQDAKPGSTPRGAMPEDLNSAPFQDLTSQLSRMIAYYVGDVNRTHPKFVGHEDSFSTGRVVELLEGMLKDFDVGRQHASGKSLNAPRLSISIPVYNAASFLPRCLDSVLESVRCLRGAGCEVEIVCVDDGSTDGSGAILDEYKEKVERRGGGGQWKIIHQKNAGTAAAREAALRASTGDWIASVDPDDWVEADFLANILRVAESSDADLIWCDYRTDYEDGRPSEMSHECAGDDLDAYVLGILNNAHAGAQWNKLIRRAFVMQHDIHYPDGRIPVSEDLWFTMEVLNCRPRIRFAPHADYHYCIRRGSATQSPYTYARFAGFVRLQGFLEGLALPEEASRIVRERRKGIKFGAYRHLVVSDEEFHRLYPEVRDLWDHDTPIWHKILFWFAVRGFKPLINRLWR